MPIGYLLLLLRRAGDAGVKGAYHTPDSSFQLGINASGPTYRFAATISARRMASMLWTVGMTKSALLIKPFSTS